MAFNGFCLTLLAARDSYWLAAFGALGTTVALYAGYWLLKVPVVRVDGDECTIQADTFLKQPLTFSLTDLSGWKYDAEAGSLMVRVGDRESSVSELRLDQDGEAQLPSILGAGTRL